MEDSVPCVWTDEANTCTFALEQLILDVITYFFMPRNCKHRGPDLIGKRDRTHVNLPAQTDFQMHFASEGKLIDVSQ